MSAPRIRAGAPSLRFAGLIVVAALLAACAEQPTRPAPSTPTASRTKAPASSARKPWQPLGPYTPGGLYAPGVSDGAPDVPPDIAKLPEPVPHPEPLSHYGNRSPYVVLGKSYAVLPSAAGYDERGMASWYGTKFDGRVTSSFEPYDLSQFTAAHKTLPLPSYARVTNLENGRSVIVRINDRGPFHEGRLIDLSYAAAIKLGVNVHGTAMVEVQGIDTGQPLPASNADHVATRMPARAAPAASKAPVVAAVDAGSRRDADDSDDPGDAIPTPGAQATGAATALDVMAAGLQNVPAASAATSVPLRVAAAPAPGIAAATATEPPTRPRDDAAPVAAASSAPAPPAAVAPPPQPSPATSSAGPATGTALPASAIPPAIPGAPAATVQATPPPGIATPAVAAPGGQPAPALVPAAPTAALPGRAPIDPATLGFLQVASYGDRGNAERMMQRLQQAGVDRLELVSVQVADQTLWRVHVGPLRADEADQMAARLDALGFGTPPFFKE